VKLAHNAKVSKRVRKGNLAPVTRNLAPTRPKIKKRPRGKSFQPGNSFGVATRFRPGESGNPAGAPRYKKINEAAQAHLAMENLTDPAGRTFAETYIDAASALALDGNLAAIAWLADRAEGRPGTSLEVQGGEDQLAMLLAAMNAKVAGTRPEGYIPYQPLLGAGHDHETQTSQAGEGDGQSD
jgi:hypothetical protein